MGNILLGHLHLLFAVLPLEVLAAPEGPAVHELLEDALLAPRDGVVPDLVVVPLQDGHAVGPAAKGKIYLVCIKWK